MHPLIPRFATVRSVLSAWVLTSQHTSFLQDTSRLIGGKSDGDHTLGQFAEQLARDVFRGAYPVDSILAEHTNFGLFTSFLSPVTRQTWRREVASGTRHGLALVAAAKRQHEFEAPTLRFCPSCMEQDVKDFGMGHWRVFHQWPIARHCVVHGDRLHTHCKECGSPIERHNREQIVGGPCGVCGSRAFTSSDHQVSRGYWPLLRLLYRTLAGETAWAQGKGLTLDLAMHFLERQGRDLLQQTLNDWEVDSVDELGTVLGFAASPQRHAVGGNPIEGIPWLQVAAMVASSGLEVAQVQLVRSSTSPA